MTKQGNCLDVMAKMKDGSVDFVLADPPYSTFPLINQAIKEARRISKGGCMFFMYAEDLCLLDEEPSQVIFWVKPVSTKNTIKNYSRFVEVIAVYDVQFVRKLHWSNRTGIFTDCLDETPEHPHGKPESLIKRILLNHVPDNGSIFDPFAGSGTTERVAKKLGMQCTGIEIDKKWIK